MSDKSGNKTELSPTKRALYELLVKEKQRRRATRRRTGSQRRLKPTSILSHLLNSEYGLFTG
jgi:hypothetical protein